MELRQIRDLMSAMRRNRAKRLVFEEKGVRLELELDTTNPDAPVAIERVSSAYQAAPVEHSPMFRHIPPMVQPSQSIPAQEGAQKPESKATPSEDAVDGNSDFVSSPIVGTFYTAPSPDADPFVSVGDMVEEGTVVCIVEAMKVMNEVKAGIKGRVEEVLIPNGEPVAFGTKLIRIRK